MRKLVSRGLVSLGLVATLGFATALMASAGNIGSTPPTSGSVSTAMKTYRQELAAFDAQRDAIEASFRANVALARSNYRKALLSATSSAERSAAQQTEVTAIIDAAATRSAALVTLGNPPAPPQR